MSRHYIEDKSDILACVKRYVERNVEDLAFDMSEEYVWQSNIVMIGNMKAIILAGPFSSAVIPLISYDIKEENYREFCNILNEYQLQVMKTYEDDDR